MKPLQTLYLLSFFLSLQFAVTVYINSTFVSQFIGEKYVGVFYTFVSALAIFGLLLLPSLIIKFGNFRLSNLILLFMFFSLLFLFQIKEAVSGLILLTIYLLTNAFIVFSRDIFIEKYSREETVGQTRGLFLTVINLGFVLAPGVAGFLAARSLNNVYLLAAILTLPAFFLFNRFKKFHDPHYKPPILKEIIKKFKKDKSVSKFI